MSLSENTDSAILLVSSPHGRGVIEIWTRDEINNMDLGEGVEGKQSIWIIWGTKIQMWSCIHENPKIWSYDAKNLLKSNLFSHGFETKRCYFTVRRRRIKIFGRFFWLNAA